jgi:hypothetical protein
MVLAMLLAAGPARADFSLTRESVQDRANGVLGVLGLSVVPNETASALSIQAAGGEKLPFTASQLGGAFTLEEIPLYLEGFAGVARYDPDFVFSDGTDDQIIDSSWTSVAGTVGVGWDFALTDELVLRPIANLSLGHVESDASLAARFAGSNPEAEFLEDGRLNAYGYGGALMLDWQRYREAYEFDVELRFTHIRLESFDSSEAVQGAADATTLGLWSRVRVPTGATAFGSPVRAVGEFAASRYFGAQTDAIDSDYLAQVGGGVEFDFAAVSWLPADRTRLMARFVFGQGLWGFSTGIGITF